MYRMWIVLFVASSFVSSSAYGLDPIPGEEKFAAAAGSDSSSLAAGLMFGEIDDAFYLQLNPRFDFSAGKFGLGFQVPLNLRVHPWGGKGEAKYGAKLIRSEDWDEPSDFLKLVRYVRYGQKRDFIYVRLGELAADLGHGTIVSRYMNNTDINTFRLGVQFDLNTDYGGFETMVSDVVSMTGSNQDSQLVGFRGYIKPVGFFMDDSPLNIFSVGVSFVTDGNAPDTLKQGAAGGNEIDPETKDVIVEKTKGVQVIGFDMDVDLLHNDVVELVPYTDFNVISGAGWGWHLGILSVFKLPVGLDLRLPIRLEYRRFKSNYIPQYFGSFYEIERYINTPAGTTVPKGNYVRGLNDGDGLNGFYGDLAFDFVGLVQVGGILEAYEGYGSHATLFLSVPALEVVEFKAYYERTGIEDAGDLFKLDDRSLLIAQGQYQLMPYVYLVARFNRKWILRHDGEDKGTYKSTDSWNTGLEFSFNL
ncbi:MAG: hypothetical protein VYA34_14940 [Myxococcota bacterium]|nr:hypothetical protein [Myxococcota bacterium]